MIRNGHGKGLEDDSLIELETDQHNFLQSQLVHQRIDKDKNFMEMEGRGYSDLFRNSSEEMFLKSLMESPAGIAPPTMEMLGFKNISQSFRVDSEELFNSWLTNGESNGHSSTTVAHRTRQASRRMSTEIMALSNQHVITQQKKSSNDVSFAQNSSMIDQLSDQNQSSMRTAVEKGLQATNLYLAKAWFHSSQPMTRSRSSELRKRYAAMQNFQTSFGMEAPIDPSGRGISRMKQDFPNTSKFCDVSMSENHNQLETFMSPSNSSTSPFSTPMPTVDSISSVVSMLKGTLERKKLGNQVDKETVEGTSLGFYGSQEIPPYTSPGQVPTNPLFESPGTFQTMSPIQMKDSVTSQQVNGAPANPMQMSAVSQEPSQSESSAAAPVFSSTGFEVCDGPTNSGQTLSVCESSRKQVGNGSLEYGSKSKDFRERILENKSKDDRKKASLVRMGSVTSGGSVEKADPTKKRRVERSRKMAEAKERNMTPAISSDMQSLLKRCENLEKEVRSLKLNLSFMNRKDSEQTKQIEELQKQNEELADEKERLLEEIERIMADTGNM